MQLHSQLNYRLIIVLLSFMLINCGGSGSNSDDSNPDDFTFTDETDVPLAEYIVSDAIDVEGINTEADIRIEGGEYSINGGAFTDEDGEVTNLQTVRVRVMSSDLLDTETELTLYIGNQEDTFTVRTVALTLSAKSAFKGLTFSWRSAEGADYYRLLEKATADSEFVLLGRELDSAAIGLTEEKPIHKLDWYNTEYKLEACTNADCSTTDEISVYSYMRRAIAYIKASNTESHDRFGKLAISADGNTLAVGAPGEDSAAKGFNGDDGDNSTSGAGAVFIYVKDNGTWRFQTYVKASNTDEADAFGTSVSLSSDGNTLAVGAPFEDSDAQTIDGAQNNNNAEDSGAVYVFRRSGDVWIQQNYIKASNSEAGDNFGTKVALSTFGASLAVAAPGEDSADNLDGTVNTVQNSGAVYMYALNGDIWEEEATLKASNAGAADNFGSAISIAANGKKIVVGAINEQSDSNGVNADDTDNSANLAGAAYVFDKTDSGWQQTHYLKASNSAVNQRFGASVSISADASTIAVGAIGESSIAIGINGDQTDTSVTDAGAAYVFSLINNTWVQQAYVKSSNGDEGDLFGTSISLSSTGNLLAVGAIGESSLSEGVSGNQGDNSMSASGAVYVYERKDNTWQQIKYVKAPNTNAGDNFGSSLMLNASGNTLVVSAPEEQGDSTNFDNIQSNNALTSAGAIYMY
ncbi:hypothetical protein TDB9533_00917 [Thalassocella blandensis]|nr:hypothetical protein TDB9533_00917 [Thalassocella blandensis]